MARIAVFDAQCSPRVARQLFRQVNKDVKVNRVNTAEYGISITKRPFNSRLDKSKLI